MKIILCVFQCILIGGLIVRRFKKDKVSAIFIAAILAYSIFTEINYAIFPEFIGKYVNLKRNVWYEFYFFITLSFVLLFFFSQLADKIKIGIYIKVTETKTKLWLLAVFLYDILLIISLIIVFMNWHAMSYASNVRRQISSAIMFSRVLNDYNVYYFLILLTAIKYCKKGKKRKILLFSMMLCLLTLGLYTFKTGDRSVIVLCFVGLFIYLYYEKQVTLSDIKKMVLIVVLGLAYLFYVRIARSEGRMNYEIVHSILQDDYAFPAMTLIGSMCERFINPFIVIKCFITKGLFVLPGKYLYYVLYETVFPQFIQQALSTGTNVGIGFYIFTEGYVFAGIFGVIYNGFVISLYMRIWKILRDTNDQQTNTTIASIMMGVLVLMVRTETVYFIRNFVLFLIPAIIMYSVICGKKFKLCIKR